MDAGGKLGLFPVSRLFLLPSKGLETRLEARKCVPTVPSDNGKFQSPFPPPPLPNHSGTLNKGSIEGPAGPANAVPLSEAVCNTGPLFD